MTIAELETRLNDFDPATRAHALSELLTLARQGAVPLEPERDIANMHCHTFFSFNAYGHSPTSLAWLAKRRGFKLIGSVDFDVLDAVDEFLTACDQAGVRASTGIETRVFLPEFATREINSPGEPGIYYAMGIGFASGKVSPAAAAILADLRQRAAQRNRDIVKRLNGYLDPVTVDYDRDVIPLTPGGNPTERHIVVAYVRATAKVADPAAFWAVKLKSAPEQIIALMNDPAKFQNQLRSQLMKRGGVGYVQPGEGSFPTLDTFHAFINECGALPCATWLDGTSTGEQAIDELLELVISKGALALNIIPDRNWNIADPDTKRVKLQNLYDVVKRAQQLALPLNIGTEMNSFGNKLVDDFDAPELAPVRQTFLDGAYFIYGHTVLQRQAGLGYQSAWAKSYFPSRQDRNAFYTQVGYHAVPGHIIAADASLLPAEILSRFRQSKIA